MPALRLKMVKFEVQTDASGVAQFDLNVPGATIGGEERFVAYGDGWFENPSTGGGDWLEMYVCVKDAGLAAALGVSVGDIIGSYVDTDMPAAEQGWFIPPDGKLRVEGNHGEAALVTGTCIRAIAHRADGAQGETFRANVSWSKIE